MIEPGDAWTTGSNPPGNRSTMANPLTRGRSRVRTRTTAGLNVIVSDRLETRDAPAIEIGTV